MSSSDVTRPEFALGPERVADVLQQCPDNEVLIDFDYTLFGSNSTEHYLARARPAFIVSFLLFLIRGLVPWRRIAGQAWFRVRDYVSVVIVTILMPWNLLCWRRDAPSLFASHSSHPLTTAIANISPLRITIVSFGFDMLVGALLSRSPWRDCRRICMPFITNPGRLRIGKLAMVRKVLSPDALRGATMITDSEDDRDVLDHVAHPVLIQPTGPQFVAESALYLPLRYTSSAKYNPRYVRDQIFVVELCIVLLATMLAIIEAPLLIFSVVVLFLSLYAIYEIGYFENDHSAALREAKPVVSAESAAYKQFPLERQAWAWGIVLGFCGCGIETLARTGELALSRVFPRFALWLAVLVAVRILFFIYNRRPSERRLLVYPAVQASKLFGVFVLIAPSLFGIALAFAQIMMMWMNYAIYRSGGDKSSFPRDGIRLVTFVILSAGIVAVRGTQIPLIEITTGLSMLLWALLRLFSSRLLATLRRDALS